MLLDFALNRLERRQHRLQLHLADRAQPIEPRRGKQPARRHLHRAVHLPQGQQLLLQQQPRRETAQQGAIRRHILQRCVGQPILGCQPLQDCLLAIRRYRTVANQRLENVSIRARKLMGCQHPRDERGMPLAARQLYSEFTHEVADRPGILLGLLPRHPVWLLDSPGREPFDFR